MSFKELKAQIYWPTTDQNVRVQIPIRLIGVLDNKVLSKVTKTITIEVNITQSDQHSSTTQTLGESFSIPSTKIEYSLAVIVVFYKNKI